ncbi:unnamed protein product [Absidia cylindrospora]
MDDTAIEGLIESPEIIIVTEYVEYYEDDDDELEEEEMTINQPSSSSEPFGIVLVNIKKAAEEHYIHCENKWLDGQTPYVALSYRWGELDEQMVAATEDYQARIVSFQLDDFFRLCQTIQHEPDMKHIEYVWVDAICVDQENIEKRKATIYRMNDIYVHSAAIVAVPDLHSYHLLTTNTANSDAMAVVEKYRRYLYYLLDGSTEAKQSLVDLDHAFMDALGMPASELFRRDLIHVTPRNNNNNKDHHFIQQMMTLMLKPYTKSAAAAAEAPIDFQAKAEYYQQLSCRLLVEFQRQEWQQQLDQRKTDVSQSMRFLQSIMEDWSNRTWVISEYHIARKRYGKIKFWFNLLSSPELYGYRFFEFDFKNQPAPTSMYYSNLVPAGSYGSMPEPEEQDPMADQYPYTAHMFALTKAFKTSMRRRLTRRTVLEMMLQTRASKSEDRFHAIVPLVSKYKHHIKDKHSISSWGISDMLSVRLKLLEWLDTKDRLNLLFSTRHRQQQHVPLLPTFASNLKAVKPGLHKYISQYNGLNFDIDNSDSVRLERGTGGGLDVIWLCPSRHYFVHCDQQRLWYDAIGGKANKLWQQLGLDPVTDTLEAVSIPIAVYSYELGYANDNDDGPYDDEDTIANDVSRSDIQLIGSWQKNVWIVYRFCNTYKKWKIYPSRTCPMDQHPEGFRIY